MQVSNTTNGSFLLYHQIDHRQIPSDVRVSDFTTKSIDYQMNISDIYPRSIPFFKRKDPILNDEMKYLLDLDSFLQFRKPSHS